MKMRDFVVPEGFATLRVPFPFPLAAGPLQSTVIKELRCQDDGPLVDLVTREQAAKLMGISLREFDRVKAEIPRFKLEYVGRTFYKKRDIEALASAHTVVKLRNFWDDHS